jgi:ribosomal subunit interface protein
MFIDIQSKSVPVTRALRAFAREQVEKLKRQGARILSVRVFLELPASHAGHSRVKFIISIPGREIVVTRDGGDMYQTIRETGDRAVRQLRKFLEQRRDLQRRGAGGATAG